MKTRSGILPPLDYALPLENLFAYSDRFQVWASF